MNRYKVIVTDVQATAAAAAHPDGAYVKWTDHVAAIIEVTEERNDMKAMLLELAGECAECGGTGSVQCGDDPTGKPAMFPCDACWDIREAAGCS
jgi:hypothetical protein